MEIRDALAFLDGCAFWSFTSRAASCRIRTPKPQSGAELAGWEPFARTAVRRKAGEPLESMLLRLVAAAQARKAAVWAGRLACGACGSESRLADIRPARAFGLKLCRSCRQGLGGHGRNSLMPDLKPGAPK